MARGLSMRDAINAKCRECIHDPLARGTWREQVQECTSAQCPLFPLRPLPIGVKRAEDCTGKAQSPATEQDNHEPSGKDTAA